MTPATPLPWEREWATSDALGADDATYAAVLAAVSGVDVSVDDAEAAIAAGALDGGR